jgi:hypothetical protein
MVDTVAQVGSARSVEGLSTRSVDGAKLFVSSRRQQRQTYTSVLLSPSVVRL